MSLRILIIEDEQLGMERLEKNLLSIDPFIEIAGTAESVRSSVLWLRSNPEPDLIIMDIDLGDGQSFDILKEVAVSCAVIFTTCYDEHALSAFRLSDIPYLLKPIKNEDIIEVIAKFRSEDRSSFGGINIEQLVQALQQQFTPKEFRQRFLVKTGRKLTSIETTDISYFYSEGPVNYVRAKDKRKMVVEHSIEELEKMLNPRFYFRVNGFCIVALESVAKAHDYSGGCILLSLIPAAETKAVIPRHRVRAFKAWMANS